MTRLDEAGAVVDGLAEQLGGVDVFVADAGTGDNAPFLDITLEQCGTPSPPTSTARS